METALTESAPFFSVLIVNYNCGEYVQMALNSLKRQTFRDFEVCLIDNGSSDGSIENLKTDGLPAFCLMAESENHGFARGNNLAAGNAHGRWLALLNPDATAAPDWLQKVADGIARHADTESFACTQIAMDDADRLDGVGDNYLAYGIPWRGGYRRPVSELPEEGECFSACGASAIVRRDVFQKLGGFDERLFCYCEDVDLGYRLRLAGGRCIFLPEAQVEHLGGGSSDKVSGFAVRLGTRNRLWIYLKNTPTPLLLAGLPLHVALTLAILARGLFTGRFGATWQGLKEAFAGLGTTLDARRSTQATRQASTADLLRTMALNPMTMLGRRAHIVRIKPTE